VTSAEARALLGAATPEGTGNAKSCRWGTVVNGHGLILMTYAGMPPQAMQGIRQGMAADAEEAMDEPTVSAGASSGLTSFGVVLIAPKGGRLLQLQYHLGHKGAASDRDALRALAKAAVGRF
jgi:hypothetical protein